MAPCGLRTQLRHLAAARPPGFGAFRRTAGRLAPRSCADGRVHSPYGMCITRVMTHERCCLHRRRRRADLGYKPSARRPCPCPRVGPLPTTHKCSLPLWAHKNYLTDQTVQLVRWTRLLAWPGCLSRSRFVVALLVRRLPSLLQATLL